MSTGSPYLPDPELVAHERTYKVFNVLLRWCMVLLASAITWLTLWFATPAGFVGATFTGLVLLIGGYLFLVRHEEHQPLDPWQEGR
ncbi:MAG: hypothetical protein JWQ29_2856 [Phenylobacterium sp.]|nr:hypothetical protein [Phenylobacterium sp.]